MQSLTDIKTVDILGFPVADVNMVEAVAATVALLEQRRLAQEADSRVTGARIVTANAEILYHSFTEPVLGEMLRNADLIIPDGVGVVKAAAMLGSPVKERVAGADLLVELSAWAEAKGRSIYLLGAAAEAVEGTVAALHAKYPALDIAGYHSGYFDEEEKERILLDIQEKQPDFLFIGMGFPAQDLFFENHKARLPVGVMAGVGGSFDALSGKVKRAPLWIRRINLEWAYRFAQNPRRLGRFVALPRFMLAVRRQKNKHIIP